MSGSKSTPGEASTYDRITRLTAFNTIGALKKRNILPNPFAKSGPVPFAFVSAAEAGWPEVTGGGAIEKLAPEWLCKYLAAKRSVEAELAPSSVDGKVRPIIYRPSLIWNWQKLDVLPIIPIFNAASAVGIPFVDKTVRVETLASAIVVGIEDELVSGVQRFPEMEELASRI